MVTAMRIDRYIAPAVITLVLTAWAVDAAAAWRGYFAIGGEWLIPVAAWIGWRAWREAKA
jgi:hypothetical protein